MDLATISLACRRNSRDRAFARCCCSRASWLLLPPPPLLLPLGLLLPVDAATSAATTRYCMTKQMMSLMASVKMTAIRREGGACRVD